MVLGVEGWVGGEEVGGEEEEKVRGEEEWRVGGEEEVRVGREGWWTPESSSWSGRIERDKGGCWLLWRGR